MTRVGKDGLDSLKPEDRVRLLSLPFKLIPSRHRLGLIEDDLQERILEARRVFAAGCRRLRPAVEFFDADSYNAASTIQDNILFGKVVLRSCGEFGDGPVADRRDRRAVRSARHRSSRSATGFPRSGSPVRGCRRCSARRLGIARALLRARTAGPERCDHGARRRPPSEGASWSARDDASDGVLTSDLSRRIAPGHRGRFRPRGGPRRRDGSRPRGHFDRRWTRTAALLHYFRSHAC